MNDESEEAEYGEYAFWQAVREALEIQSSYPHDERWRSADEFLKGYAPAEVYA